MPAAIPERRIQELWQNTVQRRTGLVTEENGPVKIIYPGRYNDGRGADIKDAVIATGQGLFKGDIEIHVRSSAWKEHNHHRDPAYNSVILHVVKEHDAGSPALLENGLTVPTLALDCFTEEQPARRITSVFTPLSPAHCKADPALITGVLEAAGEQRFFQKCREFEEAFLKEEPGQALYQGIMVALGYSRNKTPMAQLAGAVPLEELEAITAGAISDEACTVQIQARLLGGAGLLPSQRPEKRLQQHPPALYETELEQIWETGGGRQQLSYKAWEFFKVRPGNYPTRRLAAAGVILTRFRKRGLVEELKDIIVNTRGTGAIPQDTFTVPAQGYWSRYTDFGLPAKSAAPALVGAERAGEITINALLPFFTAWGRFTGQETLAAAALNAYRQYPAGAENSLERHMRRQLDIPGKLLNNALKRQGLLHLYKVFCTQGRCGECPLGRTKP